MDDLELAHTAAAAGADVVASWFGHIDRAEFKGEVDPVTEADRQAEEAIVAVLRRQRPQDAIVAEEGGGVSGSGGGRRWVVDPLDGTVNFLHDVPHVAVSVGLWDGDGPLAAAVIDVFRREVFTARRNGGAQLNGSPIHVSSRSTLSEALVATGFPYDRWQHASAYAATVGAVLERVQGIRRLGTASLDVCWLGAGRFDGFWEYGLAPWDVAAGLLVVTEAGGRVTDPAGRPAGLGAPTYVMSNGLIHEPLQKLIAQNLPAHVVARAAEVRSDPG